MNARPDFPLVLFTLSKTLYLSSFTKNAVLLASCCNVPVRDVAQILLPGTYFALLLSELYHHHQQQRPMEDDDQDNKNAYTARSVKSSVTGPFCRLPFLPELRLKIHIQPRHRKQRLSTGRSSRVGGRDCCVRTLKMPSCFPFE